MAMRVCPEEHTLMLFVVVESSEGQTETEAEVARHVHVLSHYSAIVGREAIVSCCMQTHTIGPRVPSYTDLW